MAGSNPHLIAIGTAIREVRKRRGISQERMAELADMHRTYVGGIERGEKNPTYLMLTALAAALDVRLVDLVIRAYQLETRTGP